MQIMSTCLDKLFIYKDTQGELRIKICVTQIVTHASMILKSQND